MYEVFEHTADLGLRIRAPEQESLFAEAARAFFSIIVTNLDEVRPLKQVSFQIDQEQLDYLLFDWLNELLFTFETQRLVFSDFDIKLIPTGLQAMARGEPLDPARHVLEHEVKAITYHGLRVVNDSEGSWLAEVIVDI